MPRVTPMFHVPDVEATARWYEAIGFTIRDLARDCDDVTWAALAFGESEIMLSIGGRASDAPRREVDLYLTVDDVEAAFRRVEGKAEIVEPLHDTFYGMREFIIRDCNRFWITFGQPLKR
jgi:uncharacterized glyoxalase superfamily protein PhnB